MTIVKRTLIGSIILVLLSNMSSLAEVGHKTPSHNGVISAGPYYNPTSKSYFELFKMQSTVTALPTWDVAKKLADKTYFKNAQGRLAIIRDLETHRFLLQNFSSRNYWIGLQYFCGSKKLTWVDGTDATQSKFSAWDSQWANSYIRCAGQGYMPVHYTTSTTTKSLRWRASGPVKGYYMYLVEYPTGEE